MSKEAMLLVVIHILLFIGIMFAVYRSSGWSTLTKSYRFRGKFGGTQRWVLVSARMGIRQPNPLLGVERPLSSLRNALNVRVNETGLYLSIFPLFRLFHPPLFFPWDHISTNSCSGLAGSWVEFHFREAPSVVLRLTKSVAAEVLMYTPRLNPMPTGENSGRQLMF